MRRSLTLAALALTAAGAASAVQAYVLPDGPPLRAAATLDCPASQGDLIRTAKSPDGQWCDYSGRRGETVRLRLAAVHGQTPSEALAATRAQLHALVPVYRDPIPVSYAEGTGDRADVDVPFVHVHADGDQADVRLFGIHINARGRGDDTDVDIGHGHKHSVVHAGLRGAEVMADEIGRSNVSLVYVLAANHREPSGFRAAGYVARGPVTGPLVVAEFRSPVKSHTDGEGDHGDIDRLIDRNLGH